MERDDWLAQLRTYIGVPFLHQGRTRNGIDCIGLVHAAAKDLGVGHLPDNIVGYNRTPDNRLFAEKAADFLIPLPYNRLQPMRKQVKPGDILIFWIERKGFPRHIGVYTGTDKDGRDTMIHSYARQFRAVVEMPLDMGYWGPRVDSAWTLPYFGGE